MSPDPRLSAPVVGLLGAGPSGPADIGILRRLADRLVAADGGALAALAAGWMPDLVIGDMDSLPPETRRRIPARRLCPVADQDSTDFQKCLAAVDAQLILGAGFLGARIDHTLAAMTALVRDGRRILLLGPEEIAIALPPRISLDLPAGLRVSLYPLAPVTGRSTGLRWPIDGLALAPDGRIGTSNEAMGRVAIETDGPGLLLIMPREGLDAVLDAWRPAARAR